MPKRFMNCSVDLVTEHKYLSTDVCYRGLIPLHNACSYGHFEVAELLLDVRFSFITHD